MTIFTVAAEDILGENYKLTKIECSDYNPNIDDSITVTITVTDVYGDAISGENVTVTASEGTFTQLNGSDITASDSVTGTTNSSGEFTLTYSCTHWGLITFTANNVSTQVQVGGWKQINTYLSDRVTLYSDGRNGYIKVDGTFTWSADAGVHDLTTIDNNYLPKGNATTNYDPASRTYMPVYLYSNGAVAINKAQTSSSNVTIICTIYYPLATPQY